MRDMTIGQYYPAQSVVHRMDPRIKLLSVIAYIVTVFFVHTFTGYGIMALFLLFVVLVSRVPLVKVLKSVRAVLFLVVFSMLMSMFFYSASGEQPLVDWWIFKLYASGIVQAVKMALRLVLLVLGPSLLTLTTTPVELTDGLERLLKPLTYLRIPVHELSIIMSIALRLIPTLVEETDKIMSAQKARCAQFDTGNLVRRAKALLPVLIPLFVGAFRRADELAYAMDARCYRGAKGRTRMKVLVIHARDVVALLVMAALLFVILTLRYNWFDFSFITYLVGHGF